MEMNLSLLVKPDMYLPFGPGLSFYTPVNLRVGANPCRHIIPFCFFQYFYGMLITVQSGNQCNATLCCNTANVY